jgi:hypothetical protein
MLLTSNQAPISTVYTVGLLYRAMMRDNVCVVLFLQGTNKRASRMVACSVHLSRSNVGRKVPKTKREELDGIGRKKTGNSILSCF